MTLKFTPAHLQTSSSFAVSSSVTFRTLPAGTPTTASFAEYAINSIGPSGSDGITVTGYVPGFT